MLALLLSVALAEVREARAEVAVYVAPARGVARRGTLAVGAAFEVLERVEGPGCPKEGWGRLAADGYACLDRTIPTDAVPEALPRARYGELPWLHARRTSRRPGPVYPSLDAYLAGEEPVRLLDRDSSFAFDAVRDTAKGPVLVHPDGWVVPRAKAAIYDVSTFRGRDLGMAPLAEGQTLAWCLEKRGCLTAGGVALSFQEAFVVEETPLAGRSWVRTLRREPPPPEVGPDELWVDVHLAEQTLLLSRGDVPLYATLVAAGKGREHETPKGTFRVLDKRAENDMSSQPGSPEPYFVEAVPYVIHVLPRIALHGAFWHGQFGIPTSHGCINLSPADARTLFGMLGPALPPGWSAVWPTEADPGTVVRVR